MRDDDILRAALEAEADGVAANDDLLDRIREASARRSSVWRGGAPWFLAAAALAVIVGIVAVISGGNDDQGLEVADDQNSATTERLILPPELALPALCQDDEATELPIYLHPGISEEALDSLAQRLRTDPRVATVTYQDQDAAYAEFRALFADSPELLDTVTADILPSRYDVTLHDQSDRESVKSELETAPGVYEIVDAAAICRDLETAERPAQAVAVTRQGHVAVVDTSTGDVIRDLGGFDDPTDPEVADREGGAYAITGVALHPNGRDVYFETCCEPASGAIFRVPIDGSVQIDAAQLEPVAFGFGIDISADGRWLGYVHPAGATLYDLESGTPFGTPVDPELTDLVQVAVNADGTEITVERALEYGGDSSSYVQRSELITLRRVDLALERSATAGGDIRLLPVYANGELAQVAARDGVIDVGVDATGRWFLATPSEGPLRGYSAAGDEQEIPGGPYVAADW